MEQPDIPLKPAFFGELQKDGSGLKKGGGCRMIVIGAGSGQTGSRSSPGFFIDILHIRGVVMISQDHRFASLFTGDHYEDIALVALSLLIHFPSAKQGKIEVRFPTKGHIPAESLALQPGCGNGLPM